MVTGFIYLINPIYKRNLLTIIYGNNEKIGFNPTFNDDDKLNYSLSIQSIYTRFHFNQSILSFFRLFIIKIQNSLVKI